MRNFQIDKYYSELENVENKLNRIRSEKGPKPFSRVPSLSKLERYDPEAYAAPLSNFSSKQYNPSPASKDRHSDTNMSKSKMLSSNSKELQYLPSREEAVKKLRLDFPEREIPSSSKAAVQIPKTKSSKLFQGFQDPFCRSSQHRLEEECARQQLAARGSKPERGRLDQQQHRSIEIENYNNLDHDSRVRSKYRDNQDFIKETLREVSREPTEAPSPKPRKEQLVGEQEEQVFLDETNQLYNLNISRNNFANPKSSASSMDLLVGEIRKRDAVYKVVQERFRDHDQESYSKLLEESFRREALLAKIVNEFKKMSSITISDLDQLYYFIKTE